MVDIDLFWNIKDEARKCADRNISMLASIHPNLSKKEKTLFHTKLKEDHRKNLTKLQELMGDKAFQEYNGLNGKAINLAFDDLTDFRENNPRLNRMESWLLFVNSFTKYLNELEEQTEKEIKTKEKKGLFKHLKEVDINLGLITGRFRK